MAKQKNVNVKVSSKPKFRTRFRKQKPLPTHLDLSKESDNFRHVVRICNRDIPGYINLQEGLRSVYGLNIRICKAVDYIYKKKYNKDTSKVGYFTDDDAKKVEEIVDNIDQHIPSWLLNRPKLREGGQKQLVMADLRLVERKDLQRLGKMKSYRGLRLQWGLPVRGQKTRTGFRREGSVIGVTKRTQQPAKKSKK